MLADVNHYRVNELQAADRTLQQIVQFYIEKARKKGTLPEGKTEKPSVNIIGLTTLGFHNIHDNRELRTLMAQLGIEVNLVMPDGASVHEIQNMSRAWFNLVPFREVGPATAAYLKTEFDMPSVDIAPMGIVDTARCIRAIQQVLNQQGAAVDYEAFIDEQTRFVSQAAWFSRSIDCQNLTGKKGRCVWRQHPRRRHHPHSGAGDGDTRGAGGAPTASTTKTGSGSRWASTVTKF